MVPEKGGHREELDERLVEVRDAILTPGEKIVAQEAGDQGQGIIITETRIIMIKVGLTATGQLNGRRTGVFSLDQVQNIVLRKGPMGGVIQVVGEATTLDDDNYPPVTLVVFSYPERVKRCDAVAPALEKVLGRPIERVEPRQESVPQQAASTEIQAKAASPAEPPAPKKMRKSSSKKKVEVSIEDSVTEAAIDEPGQPAIIKETPVENKPRGGRIAKSLAEEMLEDMSSAADEQAAAEQIAGAGPAISAAVDELVGSLQTTDVKAPFTDTEPAASVEINTEPMIPEPELQAEPKQKDDEDPEPAPAIDGLRPNPRLRQPVGKNGKSGSKVLVAFGSLMLVLLLGVAITSPLRQSNDAKIELNVTQLANNPTVLRHHYLSIQQYQTELMPLIDQSNLAATSLRAAVSSKNYQAIADLIKQYEFEKAYSKLSATKCPLGLARSRDLMECAFFIRKTVAESSVSYSLTPAESLKKLSEADAKLAKGLKIIDDMLTDIQNRLPKSDLNKGPAK